MIISGLTKRFGKKVIFDNFNLEIGNKGIIALSGESGRGKTTLLRMIAGLDKKYSGKIDLGNIKKISYVFQESRLLESCTALENVSLVLKNTEEGKKTAEMWLKKLGLEDDIHTYPDEMSGGMKQRVSIARAFAYDGDLLLLDEALNGIDAERCISIMDMIIEYAKEKPCIVVTHNEEHLKYLGCKVIKI
ncbi:MAG: ABC transporter ATP-binding protein [Ruminococcaceae bacterium]|nr:ABC transporter ATP-binding protein [Oscillospiraceae bacterium]